MGVCQCENGTAAAPSREPSVDRNPNALALRKRRNMGDTTQEEECEAPCLAPHGPVVHIGWPQAQSRSMGASASCTGNALADAVYAEDRPPRLAPHKL